MEDNHDCCQQAFLNVNDANVHGDIAEEVDVPEVRVENPI